MKNGFLFDVFDYLRTGFEIKVELILSQRYQPINKAPNSDNSFTVILSEQRRGKLLLMNVKHKIITLTFSQHMP